MREFYCANCKFYFAAAKYWENPCFLADMVTVCPDCGGKCWENKQHDGPAEKPRSMGQTLVRELTKKMKGQA